MAKNAFSKSKPTKFMVMAIFVAFMFVMSSEVATAIVYEAVPELMLGRKVLQAEYDPTGRGSGYNSVNPTGRGGYNSVNPTGRGGYNSVNP